MNQDDIPVIRLTRRRVMTPKECEQYGVPLGTEGAIDAGPDYEPGFLPEQPDE